MIVVSFIGGGNRSMQRKPPNLWIWMQVTYKLNPICIWIIN